MTNILHVTASIRSDESVSRKLGNRLVERLRDRTGANVTLRDLANNDLPLIDTDRFAANLTPVAERGEQARQLAAIGDDLIAELQAADVPLYRERAAGSPDRQEGLCPDRQRRNADRERDRLSHPLAAPFPKVYRHHRSRNHRRRRDFRRRWRGKDRGCVKRYRRAGAGSRRGVNSPGPGDDTGFRLRCFDCPHRTLDPNPDRRAQATSFAICWTASTMNRIADPASVTFATTPFRASAGSRSELFSIRSVIARKGMNSAPNAP